MQKRIQRGQLSVLYLQQEKDTARLPFHLLMALLTYWHRSIQQKPGAVGFAITDLKKANHSFTQRPTHARHLHRD